MPEPAASAAPPYARTIAARWGDMDFNGHMRNTAYLDAAGDTRMRYFAEHGFTVRDFERLQIGPVILRDTLEYYKELHLLEEVAVLQTAFGVSEDGSHFRIRDEFRRPDGQRVAKVESAGGWLDLRARKLAAPPPELKALLLSMPRAVDFEIVDSLLRR
jgi:acyl-CoA thioester hydrolase